MFSMQNTKFSRQQEFSELQSFIKNIDNEVKKILQSLQWDRKIVLQCKPKSTCKYDSNHKIPPEKLKEHEEKCVLKSQGYAQDDIFLPDVFDPDSNTVLKLSSENIVDIINYASKIDPVFKRGDGSVTSEPQTAERLQAAYTVDERRAIYDVVINSRPACDELDAGLALGQAAGAEQAPNRRKTKLEYIAEQRDLRRRRAKYRVGARSRNYSHTLRGLIETQMEIYTEALGQTGAKSQDESDNRCSRPAEDQSHNSSDTNVSERKGFSKGTNRNDYIEHKRKRSYDDNKSSRKSVKDRYQASTDDRRTHDCDRGWRQERNECSHKGEIKTDYRRKRDYDDDEIRKKCDKKYISYKDKEMNFTHKERDRYSSSSREFPKYRASERDVQYDKFKDINATKQKRNEYNSFSRDPHSYRDNEREENFKKYTDRCSESHRSEHKRYNNA